MNMSTARNLMEKLGWTEVLLYSTNHTTLFNDSQLQKAQGALKWIVDSLVTTERPLDVKYNLHDNSLIIDVPDSEVDAFKYQIEMSKHLEHAVVGVLSPLILSEAERMRDAELAEQREREREQELIQFLNK